jgi:hypothetical protein
MNFRPVIRNDVGSKNAWKGCPGSDFFPGLRHGRPIPASGTVVRSFITGGIPELIRSIARNKKKMRCPFAALSLVSVIAATVGKESGKQASVLCEALFLLPIEPGRTQRFIHRGS